MKMRFECPFCQQHYTIDARCAGREVICQSCNKVFTISSAAPQPPTAMPRFKPAQTGSNPTDLGESNTIDCPDCGGTVSRRANTCPHCGAPIPVVVSPAKGCFCWLLFACGCLLVIAALISMVGSAIMSGFNLPALVISLIVLGVGVVLARGAMSFKNQRH